MLILLRNKNWNSFTILNQPLKVIAETFAKNDYKAAQIVVQSTIEQVKSTHNQKGEDLQKLVSTAKKYVLALRRVMANKAVK